MGNNRIDELEALDNEEDEGSASEPEPDPDESENQDATTETEAEADEQPSEDTETEPMSTTEDNSDEETESKSTAIEGSEPAYSGDDFDRETLYCLQETSERYKDAMDRYDVLVMREEIGLRNVTQRERQEAMMRMAADHPEVIAQYIVEMRGLNVDVPDSP